MEDVITEAPPPSRFLEEDLNTFTPPSSPLHPPPTLHFPSPLELQTLNPTLLVIALSPPSLSLFHPHLVPPSKPLLATLTLPNNTTTITLSTLTTHSLLLSVPSPILSLHAHAVAKILIGDRIRPESVLILDSISPSNYRGRLSADEAVAFKLETSAERKRTAADEGKILKGLEYYPSGSVVDGLGAAVLGRCQVLNLRACLCVSWPEFDRSVMSLIEGLLRKNGVFRGEDLRFGGQVLRFGRRKGRGLESELYT